MWSGRMGLIIRWARNESRLGQNCQAALKFSIPFLALSCCMGFIHFGEDSMWIRRLLHCLRLRIVTILDHGHIPS